MHICNWQEKHRKWCEENLFCSCLKAIFVSILQKTLKLFVTQTKSICFIISFCLFILLGLETREACHEDAMGNDSSAFSFWENWETYDRCFVWMSSIYTNWKSLIWANSNFNDGSLGTYIRQISTGVWETWNHGLFFACCQQVGMWGTLYPSRMASNGGRLSVVTLIVPPDYKEIIVFLSCNSSMQQLLISSLWQGGWELGEPQ